MHMSPSSGMNVIQRSKLMMNTIKKNLDGETVSGIAAGVVAGSMAGGLLGGAGWCLLMEAAGPLSATPKHLDIRDVADNRKLLGKAMVAGGGLLGSYHAMNLFSVPRPVCLLTIAAGTSAVGLKGLFALHSMRQQRALRKGYDWGVDDEGDGPY